MEIYAIRHKLTGEWQVLSYHSKRPEHKYKFDLIDEKEMDYGHYLHTFTDKEQAEIWAWYDSAATSCTKKCQEACDNEMLEVVRITQWPSVDYAALEAENKVLRRALEMACGVIAGVSKSGLNPFQSTWDSDEQYEKTKKAFVEEYMDKARKELET